MKKFVVCFVSFAAITVTLGDSEASLEIQPAGNVITKEEGGSLAITCKPNVPNPNLVNQLEWKDQWNKRIDNTNPASYLYVQRLSGEPGAVLIFPKVTKNLAGTYTCSASYSNSEQLTAKVEVKTIVDITFKDAPEQQYPNLGQNYTVRCVVFGQPTPNVEWYRNNEIITSNDRYVISNDGLLIKNVRESDDGTYICSAVVLETGNVKSRSIKVEVQVQPIIEPMEDIKRIEGESATVQCVGTGKPPPSYQWIKDDSKEDLSKASRFTVQSTTGMLFVSTVEYRDSGTYTCVAKNKAGYTEGKVKLEVLVKPRIYELLNVTAAVTNDTKIICKVFGRPPPTVTFRKRSNVEPFKLGNNYDRISVQQVPFYEEGKTETTLTIYGLNRSDDGLYECIAKNEAGEAYKNGHITVQFPPTFERTKELVPPIAYSWYNKPGNLTCLPEAIPNATMLWRRGNVILSNMPNVIQIQLRQDRSHLIIDPHNQKEYFGFYQCVASNYLGEAVLDVELREGFAPGNVQQVTIDSLTATTVKFRIVPPMGLVGLPLRSLSVQYKADREFSWKNARNHTWSVDAPHIVENLIPEMVYNFRFSARNDVGQGQWSGDMVITMPRRSVPAEPKILVPNYNSQNGYSVHKVAAVSPYADHFELRWNVPNDNGDPIDSYVIRYCVTKKIDGEWREEEGSCSPEISQSDLQTSYDLSGLQPNTVYKIELRAHNAIGHSSPAEIRVKTALGTDVVRDDPPAISSGTIIGIVVASIFVVLLIVDLICFCVIRAGIIALLCDRSKSKQHEEEDPKLGSYKAAPAHPSSLSLPLPIKLAPSPMEEKEPLRPAAPAVNGDKATTYVEYDRGQVFSKSGELIGKHSAV